jgi:hypothetical protein
MSTTACSSELGDPVSQQQALGKSKSCLRARTAKHRPAPAPPKPVVFSQPLAPTRSAASAASAAPATSAASAASAVPADVSGGQRFWAWCCRRRQPVQTPLAATPLEVTQLAVTRLAQPAVPDCPQLLDFVSSGDPRFYVVWKVHQDEGLLPSAAIGIWCGNGPAVWWELRDSLPWGDYSKDRVHLKRYPSWADAWQAWWTSGPCPHPMQPPHVYLMGQCDKS